MIIKLETLLENGIIDPNKITELVCDGKTVYKGYSDDIASFGKDYEFIKFNNTVNESFNTPTYIIEVKAKNPVNESFTSQFGLKTKADVIKSMKYFDYYPEDKQGALFEELDYLIDLYSLNEANANQVKSDSAIANKIKDYLRKYGVKFTWRINKHIDAVEKAFRGDVNDIKLALVAMPVNRVYTGYGYADNVEGTRIVIFTDKTIEIYGKGILTGKKVRKYQLEAINDVVVNEGMVWAKVTVNFKQTGNAYESHMCLGRINKNATTAIQEFLSSYKPNIGFTREFDKDNNDTQPKEVLQEWFGKKKQEKETKSIDNIKDNVEKEPENTKTVTIDRSKNEFGQWKSYDAYKANEKKEADEAHKAVEAQNKERDEYLAKNPKYNPNTYWDAKNKCLRDKDTNEVVKKTKYSSKNLKEDVEQIDEEVLDRILLEMPLINTDKFDKGIHSDDLIDYPSSRKIIYGKDKKTEKQLKKNVDKFNGKMVRDEGATISSRTKIYNFSKKESLKNAPISNWKYVSDKDAEKYARKVTRSNVGIRVKHLEVDEDDVKRITNNDYARVKDSKRDSSKDAPNTNKRYTDELEARLKKAKEDVNKEEKKDKK